jgi:hypothetical protein
MEIWTGEENTFLLDLIDRHGTSWTTIRKAFPTRSISSIRNRYQRIVNGIKKKGRNRCLKCGMVKRGHICGGVVRNPDKKDVHLICPVIEKPPSQPWVNNTEVRHGVNEDVTEGEESEDEYVSFPCHLFSWHTMQTANDMGFEGVTHPPPLVHEFPFVTSPP